MESRSSHFIVGMFVIVGLALISVFGIWFAKADIDRTYDSYDVVFLGSVNGLQEGAVVKYRGVPVGRVQDVTIGAENFEEVIATIEVDAGTPIREDTRAVLALQGVTGLANVELEGGSVASPVLEAAEDQERPRIQSRRSAIERVFDSTPELLANAVALIARVEALLSADNLDRITSILANIDNLTAQLSDPNDGVMPVLTNTAAATEAVGLAASQARVQMAELENVIKALESEVSLVLAEGTTTLRQTGDAAVAVRGLAGQLGSTFSNLSRPLDDFGQSGLYDFTEMVRELRQLVASLSRITKEFERDPAGFLIGGNQRGFTPQ